MGPMGGSKGPERLPGAAVGAAVLVAAVWGFNFVVIKVGVSAVPPLALAALRFVFSALPAVFLVGRPKAPLRKVAAYGLLLGVGEFGFLFTAIKLGAPTGLSSILLQSQAFFTAALAALFLGEKLRPHNAAGMAIAGAGLAVFALSGLGPSGAAGLDLPLLLMVLAAGLGWAGANVVTRTMPDAGAFSLMVWSSIFSPLPLAALSLAFEGPAAIAAAFTSVSALTIGALAYLVVLSTLFGYGVWNHLIMRHGAGRIAPFSLMVPVFGIASASLVLGESFGLRDALGAGLILAGLLIHVFGGRSAERRAARRTQKSGSPETRT
jgi:O-acetylserine/cysteine efflux transporter